MNNKTAQDDTNRWISLGERPCARCGMPVKLNKLHPDSLEIPQNGERWYVVHGSKETCGKDQRAWVVEN